MGMRALRFLGLSLALLALAGGLVGTIHGQQPQGAIVIELAAPINTATEHFVKRTFADAEEANRELIIVILDTPGGEFDATREIVKVLLNSPVPSVVYVGPRGAGAMSAGTFIAAAANFAAMAPGTNIGSASPVGAGGEDLPETSANKATNAAAALLRSIAAERGRNIAKLEETVLKGTAFSAKEAANLGMVNFVATDVQDLLEQLDGQTASTPHGLRIITAPDVDMIHLNMTALERLLLFLADPNVSFLFLVLGGIGIVIEFLSPGLFVPGVVGAIFLLLAFLGLGNLPVNWAGVAFVLLAFLLFVIETQVAGFGILGAGAIISFVAGGFLMFAQSGISPMAPQANVSLPIIVSISVILTLGGGWFLWTVKRSSRRDTIPEIQSPLRGRLLGRTCEVLAPLDPRGVVFLDSEEWSAVSQGGKMIPVGGTVRIIEVDGAILRVTEITECGARESDPSAPPGVNLHPQE